MTDREKIDQALKILGDVFDNCGGTVIYPWLEKHYRPMQHDRFMIGYDEEPEELSECCGAKRADPDQDFCSQCQDHAEFSTGDE